MAKIAYIEKKFQTRSLIMIDKVNDVIDSYHAKGYDLTLRQVYYQLVAADVIPNTEKSYKNLGSLISDGRLAGLIDWKAIIDRTRGLKGLRSDDDPADAINKAASNYRLDWWGDQDYRVEVWVEKDALAGVIGSIANKLDVDYFSCRGYTSQSEMWRAAERLKYYEERYDKKNIILHLGDHDPSGIDMSRDIEERLALFGADVEFKRIALSMEQIEELSPPPNPAKITDSRAAKYIERYGRHSWELDALNPEYLDKLITTNVLKYADKNKLAKIKEREIDEQNELIKISDNYGSLSEWIEELDNE